MKSMWNLYKYMAKKQIIQKNSIHKYHNTYVPSFFNCIKNKKRGEVYTITSPPFN